MGDLQMGQQIVTLQEQELRQIQLFRNVDLGSIRGLLEACSVKTIAPEEVLIASNEINNTVYFILNGRLRIHLQSPENKSFTILGPGESVGEMSVIDGQAASAQVIANEPCTLLAMDEDILWSLIQASHAAACNLLFILAMRLRHTDSIVVEGTHFGHESQHYGSVDALTGLHNRYWFDNTLKRQFVRSIGDAKSMSLIIIDIDHFKNMNDTYGHLLGDRVLYNVAHLISHSVRPGEMLARYGGDEFVILLPDAGTDVAFIVAERVRRAVEEASPISYKNHDIKHPTISLGVAETKPGQSPEMLVHAADEALYRAKKAGRNCISQ